MRYHHPQCSNQPSNIQTTRTTYTQAALIVEESNGAVTGAGGELVTAQYFDGLAAEVDDLLQVGAENAPVRLGVRGFRFRGRCVCPQRVREGCR
jgi:hypothetical protein